MTALEERDEETRLNMELVRMNKQEASKSAVQAKRQRRAELKDFALAALSGASSSRYDHQIVARRAFDIAEAALKELEARCADANAKD